MNPRGFLVALDGAGRPTSSLRFGKGFLVPQRFVALSADVQVRGLGDTLRFQHD